MNTEQERMQKEVLAGGGLHYECQVSLDKHVVQ